VSTPELSSAAGVHPLGFSVLQSQWPPSSTEAQWTSVVVSPGQQAASLPAAPDVSLTSGSVLPINLLPAELSNLLGMTQSSVGLSSSGLPVSLLLPGGLLVSAESTNVQDPLASLSRLSTGLHDVVPSANINNNMVTTEARKMPGNTNGPHTTGIKVEPETAHLYGSGIQANVPVDFGNRLAVPMSEPSKLPGGYGNVNIAVRPQQAGTAGSQLPRVSGPPQSMSTSVYFPALHQLLQQGTIGRSMPTDPPPYNEVSETIASAGSNVSLATAELTEAPLSVRRRWTSADGAVLNRRSCWGYPEHSDVAVNLLRQESSGFDISKNSLSPVNSQLAAPEQSANADKDAAEFSAPSGHGLHHKFRRKNRPQPLIIPSPVSHFGFQSRLRSPCIVDQPGPGLSTETALSAALAISSSLPVASVAGLTPYTPPPMLSPVRTGSGLFCSLVQPSPKSAPVGFRLGILRCSK